MQKITFLIISILLFGCQQKPKRQQLGDYRDQFTGYYQFKTDFITTEWIVDTVRVDETVGEITKGKGPHSIVLTIDTSAGAIHRERFVRYNSYELEISPEGKLVYVIYPEKSTHFHIAVGGQSYSSHVYFPGHIRNDSLSMEGTVITWSTGYSVYTHQGKRIK